MKLDIQKVIADGIRAPSGENCQPWRFVVAADVLRVYNDPAADTSLYNSKQKGSYVAHGALIENACISAAEQGFNALVRLFPNTNDPDLVADISFAADGMPDALYTAITTRCTNRKAYTGQTLTDTEKYALDNAARMRGAELRIVDESDQMMLLGQALATNERVLFENRAVHDFFYEHILWEEIDQNQRGGFFIDTLEFLPHQLRAVKLLRRWRLLTILNGTIGIGALIAKENAQKYASSGSIAAITIPGRSASDFVQAGRAAQRVWLTATQLGLAVHPCTGTVFFNEQLIDGSKDVFSTKHREMVRISYQAISSAFNAHGASIPMLMRIGHAATPSAVAGRKPASITYT